MRTRYDRAATAMIVQYGIESLKRTWTASIVCIGTFDGVHLGHQELLKQATAWAKREGIPAIAVTFDRHPTSILAPDRVPPHIAPLDECLRVFEKCGIALTLVLPFTRELADQSAEQFLQQYLVGGLGAAGVVVGHDFAFGHDRQGNGAWLEQRITTRVIGEYLVDGRRVSSTMVRNLIQAGEVANAARLLGHAWVYSGIIVTGQKLGRTLGFPTINLVSPCQQMFPADGVYAGWCEVGESRFHAAISVGTRPTFAGEGRTIEAFLIDYPGDEIYGQPARLAFIERLRPELKFDNVDDLVTQMHTDVDRCQEILSKQAVLASE